MSHHPIPSLAGTDRAQRDNEKPTPSIMEHSGVRTSRDTETIVAEHLLAAVTVASAPRRPLTETESAKRAAPRHQQQHQPQHHPELGKTRTSAVPRAPRLTGCEHHFFFDISWRPTAAREDPCFVRWSFFSLFLAFSISPPLLFLFGSYAHSPNSALPRLLAPTSYRRGAFALLWVMWHLVYVMRILPLFCFVSL
jgi:hypothetical protein